MKRTDWVAWLATLAVTVSAGCGDLAWERGRVLLFWEPQETLFALSPQRGRVDAYRLHGGVLWTGGLALPADECFDTLAFDPVTARLWLRGEAGGVLVDARRMQVIARWDGAAGPAGPPPHALQAQAAAGSAAEVCAARRLARQTTPTAGEARAL